MKVQCSYCGRLHSDLHTCIEQARDEVARLSAKAKVTPTEATAVSQAIARAYHAPRESQSAPGRVTLTIRGDEAVA